METAPTYVGYMTPELIQRLEAKLVMLINGGSGYGEIVLVVEAGKIKWVRMTESEPVRTPFE